MVKLLDFPHIFITLRKYMRIFTYAKVQVTKYFYIFAGSKYKNHLKKIMSIGLESVRISAVYCHNETDNVYTITVLGKGGPIVTGATLEEAKAKFEKALSLSFAVNNLVFFKRYKTSTQLKNRGYLGLTNEITYTELQVA